MKKTLLTLGAQGFLETKIFQAQTSESCNEGQDNLLTKKALNSKNKARKLKEK